MEQVEEICSEIILMNQGKKVLEGSVKQIKQDFKENLFRIGFEEAPPVFDTSLFNVVSEKENFMTVRINEGTKPSEVLREFLSHYAGVVYFNEILPTLNDIFLRKVEHTKLARQFENVA
jgi:ABC-2 type transport system ATP-binding protein